MAWIRDRVNPDFPDETNVVLGIDRSARAEFGERVVSLLLNYGMEGDEGVFHLLPHDLCCQVTRSGGLVTVDLLTTLIKLTWKTTLDGAEWDKAKALGLIPHDAQRRSFDDPVPGDDDPVTWVTVLSAAIPFPEDAEPPAPPIVLIDHEGVTGFDELLGTIPEAGVHIVGPKPDA